MLVNWPRPVIPAELDLINSDDEEGSRFMSPAEPPRNVDEWFVYKKSRLIILKTMCCAMPLSV